MENLLNKLWHIAFLLVSAQHVLFCDWLLFLYKSGESIISCIPWSSFHSSLNKHHLAWKVYLYLSPAGPRTITCQRWSCSFSLLCCVNFIWSHFQFLPLCFLFLKPWTADGSAFGVPGAAPSHLVEHSLAFRRHIVVGWKIREGRCWSYPRPQTTHMGAISPSH